jgi:hypothetical protein
MEKIAIRILGIKVVRMGIVGVTFPLLHLNLYSEIGMSRLKLV